MPILPSSKKALRGSIKKAGFNARIRESYKLALKKARKNPTPANLKKVSSLMDKAAKINVIHKNKAGRLKSRLAKLAIKKAPQQALTSKVKKGQKKTTKKAAQKSTKKAVLASKTP